MHGGDKESNETPRMRDRLAMENSSFNSLIGKHMQMVNKDIKKKKTSLITS